jgi:hypothetical protein
MPKTQRRRSMKYREFTPATGVCQHVVIEAVFANKDSREMEDMIDNLRQYGSAVVTRRGMIADSFDEACKILQTREEKDAD